MTKKSRQLQIRVSSEQKAAIERLAREAGQSVSAYVLGRALPSARLRFEELVRTLARKGNEGGRRRLVLAEINDLLTGLAPAELREAVSGAEIGGLPSYHQNYLAAMVERAAQRNGVDPPAWTRDVEPLEEPAFATDLPGLRLHLLRSAPVVFKRRNLFVDASVGDRV